MRGGGRKTSSTKRQAPEKHQASNTNGGWRELILALRLALFYLASFSAGGLLEFGDFVRAQDAPFAYFEVLDGKAADAGADEAFHSEAQGIEHAADLPVH